MEIYFFKVVVSRILPMDIMQTKDKVTRNFGYKVAGIKKLYLWIHVLTENLVL